jgi:hypothetical protein
MGTIGCPETSVHNYQSTLRNISEEHRFNQHRGGSLKSRKEKWLPVADTNWRIRKFSKVYDKYDSLEIQSA